jgi:NAD(P)-dependent dehydrogenase (short-subunit alcohol dehydrogenase family)
MENLENKVAIITGAASGIGKAIALTFGAHGAKVVVSDLNEVEGQKVSQEIVQNGGEAIYIKADTSNPADHEKLVDQTVKHFGGLHISVNNAGIGGPSALTGEYPTEGWDKVISINLSGVFYALRYQIPAMLESGGGSIVNMASVLGHVGMRYSPAYVAAKHGVLGLTKSAALEYADQGMRINAVAPGYVDTALLTDNLSQEQIESLIKLHPMNRLGETQEIAELVLWLSSGKASFVTGSCYTADGGYLAQ